MNYLGSKGGSGVYQAIINLMPPHDTYIEPFFGSGSIFEKKAPALKSICIDLDKEIIKRKKNTEQVEFICANSIEWLANFNPVDKVLLYVDPPYVHSTRTSNAQYKHEMTDNDHRQLLKVLKDIKAYVLISGYRNSIYDELIGDWYNMDFQAMTRGGVRTETVWCNFNPGAIHYHTYAGKNFTDRQRIKRKAERWSKKFQSLPTDERQAVLAAILATNIS
ncbi:DNA adenine methylase [Aliikangiella maris]|uniref:DNA adenine methylase n=2 Tax=Aliikangiella maris TaxID=3162458 RepID=A0ABV3MTY8_9GAMM